VALRTILLLKDDSTMLIWSIVVSLAGEVETEAEAEATEVEATFEVGDVLVAAETVVEAEAALEAEVVAISLQALKTTQDDAINETTARRFLLCIFRCLLYCSAHLKVTPL
jgi:sulfate adenylyltransferase subunit 1 (EFTu-like GTPase family)